MKLLVPWLDWVATGDPMSLARATSRRSGARATITPTKLTSGSSTTDGATVATASIAPVANQPVYAAVISNFGSTPNTPTATGNGLTWVAIDNQVIGTLRKLTVFRALGASPSSGAITFDFAGQTQTSFCWSVIQCAGANTSGTDGSGSVVQAVKGTSGAATTIAIVLAAFENPNNIALVFVGLNATTTVTPDADFTELSDDSVSTASCALECEWARNQTTCDPTFSSAAPAFIAIEVKSA